MAFLSWFRRKKLPSSAAPPGMHQLAGRSYVSDAPYAFPKDEQEVNRLDFQHFLLRQLFRGNILAPLQKAPQAILDNGCGTGRWSLEIAVQFPEANIMGVDLVDPDVSKVTLGYGVDGIPPNVAFIKANTLEGLPFADNNFDYVHQRLLIAAIPHNQWPAMIRELVRVTQRGGWIELIEGNPFPTGRPAMDKLAAWSQAALKMRGIDLFDYNRIGEMLQAAGLTNVFQREYPLYPGPFDGRLGILTEIDIHAILSFMKGPITAAGVASASDFDRMLSEWRREAHQHKVKTPIVIACGQKP